MLEAAIIPHGCFSYGLLPVGISHYAVEDLRARYSNQLEVVHATYLSPSRSRQQSRVVGEVCIGAE